MDKINLYESFLQHQSDLNPGTTKGDWATLPSVDGFAKYTQIVLEIFQERTRRLFGQDFFRRIKMYGKAFNRDLAVHIIDYNINVYLDQHSELIYQRALSLDDVEVMKADDNELIAFQIHFLHDMVEILSEMERESD